MKDGFILYKKMYEPIRSYTNVEKGELLDAIFQYQISGAISDTLSDKVKIAFEFFRVQMDLDFDKYSAKCAKNKEVAEKRWNNTNECERIRTHTNDTDKEKDKGKENENEKVKVKENAKENNIPFADFWNLYDKKINAKKSEEKWNKLTDAERILIMDYLPKYKLSKPDKQYRKDPCTFLNNKSWNDEIIMPEPKDKHGSQPEETKYITPISKIPR